MHFYSPSPLSLGYIPRRSYRPALAPTYLDDDPLSDSSFVGLSYPTYRPTSPVDAETRYRRALHELQAAEEEFDTHLTLTRVRRAAVLREEALRRERALAIEAEVERIQRARALQAKRAEEYELRRAHAARVGARRQELALLGGFVDSDPKDASASACRCAFARNRPTHCRSKPIRCSAPRGNEVATLDDLLKLFSGTHARPNCPLPQSVSPATPQPLSAESQSSEEQDAGADALTAVLEFIHGLAAHTTHAANGSEDNSKPSLVAQPQAPAAEKGKGKAKADLNEAAAISNLLHSFYGVGGPARRPSDQELKDIELAIKLSLEDRNATDAKKASNAKAVRSSSGASSSRVKLDGAVPPIIIPSSANNPPSDTAKPVPSPLSRTVSPLTAIRTVRSQLSALESTFKFSAVVDFDQSVLAVSPNNAPLRTYENTLNGLLEQLDAIESDGDDEVRNARRDVVREVEKALGDLDRKINSQTSKFQLSERVELQGYDVEIEEPEAAAVKDVPVEATSAVDGAETVPGPSDAVSPVDVDVDLAIAGEYLPPLLVVESSEPFLAEPGNNLVTQTAEDAASLNANETAPVLNDPMDSTATIKADPASEPSEVYVPSSPGRETFLLTMSHDQVTFPPKPSYSDSGTSLAGLRNAVLVDSSEEGESVKSGEDGWSEVDA